MNKYKEAAELLFKRLFGIYGAEKVMRIATTCGYEIDASGMWFLLSMKKRLLNA